MRAVITCAILMVTAACVQTNAAVMDQSLKLARTCPMAVKLYSSPATVGAEYQEIALLNSSGVSDFTNESQMMTSMRQAAAKLGATGVIMGNIDEPSAGAKVAAAVFKTMTERKGKSVAIYVPGDSARVAGICGRPAGAVDVPVRAVAQLNNEPSSTKITPSPVATNAPKRTEPVIADTSGTWAQATIGRPRSESDKAAAVGFFQEGQKLLGAHEWERAEQSFQKAILLDGSSAKYHAAMGSLMFMLRRWADAEASYTAAMLIDVDNDEYRRKVKEARSRR